jgi:hypothetical protein
MPKADIVSSYRITEAERALLRQMAKQDRRGHGQQVRFLIVQEAQRRQLPGSGPVARQLQFDDDR